MSNEPIMCTGNDLPRVCADLRERGCVVNALDTGIQGNPAKYRVSYFERVAERKTQAWTSKIGTDADKHETAKPGSFPVSTLSNNPPPNLAPESGKQELFGQATPVTGLNPVALTPATLPAQGATCSTAAGLSGVVLCEDCGTEHATNVECPICAPLARLAQRFRNRKPKPSTPPQHARLPHPND